ncbi:MAG: hypothetical protein HQ519_15375 [Planctomycetes bacterium]|nr:hypothetical protein [Planctomycetota bacterium]
MPSPQLRFGPIDSFSGSERKTIQALWDESLASNHPDKLQMCEFIANNVNRVQKVAEALEAYPSVFEESTLGSRERDMSTMVDHLVQANETNYEMFVPTRALVGRTLVQAELNFWRMARFVGREVEEYRPGPIALVLTQVDEWLHGCVYTMLAEEVLGSISRDEQNSVELRTLATEKLCSLWEDYLHWAVRDFSPLLQATWTARRRIRVSLGTLLGVSELMRLLQAGCDPEFVEYFARPNPTEDEGLAFHEFLIGVRTEQIRSLEQFMKEVGRSSLSQAEAESALGIQPLRPEQSHGGVKAYRFFRERHLQATARRMRDEPGPRRTAEEYVMIYFLEKELNQVSLEP